VLICMMIMVNKVDIMGKYKNSRATNIIGWSTISVITALSLTLIFRMAISLI